MEGSRRDGRLLFQLVNEVLSCVGEARLWHFWMDDFAADLEFLTASS